MSSRSRLLLFFERGKPRGIYPSRIKIKVVQGAGSVFKVGDNIIGITVKQIRTGTNGKYAIIGRSMGNAEINGVRNVYSELKGIQKLDVEIFDASSLNGIWKTKFDDAPH
uniref:hypothetical protein n=1 Tax=Flavobacterium sp. TaxID=239 RepID=UPI00404AA2C4